MFIVRSPLPCLSVHTLSISEKGDKSISISVDGQASVTIKDVKLTTEEGAGEDNEKMVVRCSIDGQLSSSTVLMRGNSVHVFAVVSMSRES